MNARRNIPMLMMGLAALLAATGCEDQIMADQPRHEAYERSRFFEDSLAMRPVEEGTIARSGPPPGAAYATAVRPSAAADTLAADAAAAFEGRLVRELPFPVTMEMLQRGQQQFNIYCSPCHGRTGSGRGMIVLRGFRKPPSYHTERLRNAPIGHFFSVITHGYGAMYSYAARVKPEDRWAIAAYIRALQLSQNAARDDLPPDRRGELGFVASDSLEAVP